MGTQHKLELPLSTRYRYCEHPDCDVIFVPETFGLDAYFCPKHGGKAAR